MIVRSRRARVRHLAYRFRLIRYLAWHGSRLVGWLRRHLLSGRWWLLWLLLVEELGTVLALALSHHLGWVVLGIVYVFVGWVAQIFVLVLAQARKRVVVEQFTDSTGAEQKPDSRGLATLLVGELAEFRDLYSLVDERAIPTAVQKSRPLAATIKVEDVSDFLESPAMIEAKASVGPVQVPIGALFAFLGRFVRGPRLFGGVHVEGGLLVLAAQLAQQRELKTWRVECRLPAAPANARLEVPQDMVKELACRMFSDLALGGPVRWQATETFAEALSSIRHCLRTPVNRRLKLQEAERLLIKALKEDEQLGYVFYNLGVVFTELRRLAEEEDRVEPRSRDKDGSRSEVEARTHWNAAERAFRHQIRLMPDRWEAYYALAMTYKGRRPVPHWDYVLKRCDRVASMKPGHAMTAKVLLLKSDANEARVHDLRKSEPDEARNELKLLIANRRLAVAEAWSALCQSARSVRGDTALDAHLAASALKGLAVALCHRSRAQGQREHRKALHLLGRAVALAPHDAAIRFALGDVAKEPDRARAIAEIDEALRIDPTEPGHWAQLALLHAQNADTRYATYCCRQALQLIDCFDGDASARKTLKTVATAYARLGGEYVGRAMWVRQMPEVVDICNEQDPAKADVRALERLVASGDDWAVGQARVALGQLAFARGDYERAKKNFGLALRKLEKDYAEEIVRRAVRIQYAEALQRLEAPEYDDALEELRRAIGDDPLHGAPRAALADAYCAIHDYKQAERVLRDALRWDPDVPALHRQLGRCRWRLAQDCRTAPSRREALLGAVRSFSRALERSEHHKLDVQLVSHYLLARLHKELGEYDQAIPYLRRATICTDAQPLIRLLLGEAYVRAHAYDAAEDELENATANVSTEESDYGRFFEDTGWPPGRVKAYGHALLALGYVERGANSTKADEAMKAARGALQQAREPREPGQALDPAEALALDAAEAACEYVAGLLALERHENVKPNGLTTALEAFKTSLGLSPQSETYVGIARVCLQKIEVDGAHTRRWIERGEDACRNAIALDVTGHSSAQAESLLAEFAEARRWLQGRPAAREEEARAGAAPGEPFDEATMAGAKAKANEAGRPDD
jgi:tetratricopeptide (TPR) repeat protein